MKSWFGLLAGLAFSCEAPVEPPSLWHALVGLSTRGTVATELSTTEGIVHCLLDSTLTPNAVALFVGLSRGRALWRDPKSKRTTTRAMYRDLPFFRAIPHALVQTGCPVGNGTGHPGYRIRVEAAREDAERLARPGALLLARYQPPPNRTDPNPPPPGHVLGSQFVITLTDMSHLVGTVSVLGSCRDLDVVARIAERVIARAQARLLEVRFPRLAAGERTDRPPESRPPTRFGSAATAGLRSLDR